MELNRAKETIKNAAMEVVSEEGAQGATFSSIAERAEISWTWSCFRSITFLSPRDYKARPPLFLHLSYCVLQKPIGEFLL